jgi:Ca2+-binding RTX toxin-like protein
MTLSVNPTNALNLKPVGSIALLGAEISAYDAVSKRAFVTANSESSPGNPLLQIVDVSNPAAPTLVGNIDPDSLGLVGFTAGDVSSVAVSNGIVAVSLIAATKTDPGRVVFLDTNGTLLGSAVVGSQPDMLTFTPGGTKVLVANEGEPGTVDPEGTISIIDISGGVAAPVVSTATFTAFDDPVVTAQLKALGLRLFDGKTVSQDVEPEYITVSPDGKTAVISLQEANALAFLDIATATITKIAPLGLKDWSQGENFLDTSDQTPRAINLRHAPVFGQFMPDAVAAYEAEGQTFYVTANEGDDRGENARISTLTLDPTVFPDAATLKLTTELGRLNVSNGTGIRGDTDGDGDIDKLLAYGARSFSIVDAQGQMIFDSAGLIEQVIARQTPSFANANNGLATDFDTRSDDKGPEPEGVTVGSIGGRTYAFVALERAGGGVMVFDVTNPTDVSFVQYARKPGDVSPEGLVFISASSSPSGTQALLAASNEVSNTLTFYTVTETYNPDGVTTGTAAAELLDAGVGNDVVNALAGNDTIIGGEGADTINGGSGVDTVTYATSGSGVTLDLTAGTTAREKVTMLDGEPGWETRPLFTIGESLTGTSGAINHRSAGVYTPVGILDGVGAYDLNANTVRAFVTHELGETAGATYEVSDGGLGAVALKGARISYFDIDKTTLAVVDGGLAYNRMYDVQGNVVTSASQLATPTGLSRLCSASLYEANEFGAGRGIVDRIFFAGEETSTAFGHPTGGLEWALDASTGNLWAVPAMGRGSWENVVQVDTGTNTHVAFLLGDDGPNGMPLYLYVGAKNGAGDFLDRNGLKSGQLYAWKADTSGVNSPAEFASGSQVGTWIAINAQDVAMAGQAGHDALGYKTDATLKAEADAAGAFSFSRPEDLSRNPLVGNEIVFASTGASIVAGNTSDGVADATDTAGMLYKVTLDFTNLSAPISTVSVLYNGNTDVTRAIRNPDNLDWADDGMIYVQEDRSLQSLFTDPAAANPNEASVVRVNPTTGAIERVAKIDRSAVPTGQIDSVAGLSNSKGNWESSGILDVSALFGKASGTLFLSTVQAHSLTGGVVTSQSLVEGGQLVLLGSDGSLDPVIETDTLKNIENAIGTGFADSLNGNSRSNLLVGLAGNDSLSGRSGKDQLDGGDGDDMLNGGSEDDILVGGLGNDKLQGGSGDDTMSGGDGNDTYTVDSEGDVVVELFDEGTADTVNSSVSWTLDADLERLILTGSDDVDAIGNAGANTIKGNGGANFINGGGGRDTLSGGAGDDTFFFGSALDAVNNVDKISDFAAGDHIMLDPGIFTALNLGPLTSANFHRLDGALPRDAGDRILYHQGTGSLSYDADGVGGAVAVRFATLSAGTVLNASAIVVASGSIS